MDLEGLYKRYYKQLVDRLASIIGDTHEAEDRVQDIFTELLDRDSKSKLYFRDNDPIKYLHRAVTIQSRLYFDRPLIKTFDPQQLDHNGMTALVDHREPPADFNLAQKDQLDKLILVLIEQDILDLVIVMAKVYWEYTGGQVAKLLGMPESTCYHKYLRCIGKMRKALEG
jgi:DNA-directed RNA polymerase specialized sigma24 family protein